MANGHREGGKRGHQGPVTRNFRKVTAQATAAVRVYLGKEYRIARWKLSCGHETTDDRATTRVGSRIWCPECEKSDKRS